MIHFGIDSYSHNVVAIRTKNDTNQFLKKRAEAIHQTLPRILPQNSFQ